MVRRISSTASCTHIFSLSPHFLANEDFQTLNPKSQRVDKTEVEGEARFELKLITKVFKGQGFTVISKEILDSHHVLVKTVLVEYRFTINENFSIIPNDLFISKTHFLCHCFSMSR